MAHPRGPAPGTPDERKDRAYGDGWCAFEDKTKRPSGMLAYENQAWSMGFKDAKDYHNNYGR